MSSELDFIALLILIQTNLYKFGGPILMSVGTVSWTLSYLIVFTKKNLRKNPCSIYLVAFNIGSFLLIYTSLLYAILANGYKIDPSLYNLGFCHFHVCTILLFGVLNPSFLILASIDRILITSPKCFNKTTKYSSSCFYLYHYGNIVLVTMSKSYIVFDKYHTTRHQVFSFAIFNMVSI
jgi:hypothetical protein